VGPLLFIIDINGIIKDECDIKIADDRLIYVSADSRMEFESKMALV